MRPDTKTTVRISFREKSGKKYPRFYLPKSGELSREEVIKLAKNDNMIFQCVNKEHKKEFSSVTRKLKKIS